MDFKDIKIDQILGILLGNGFDFTNINIDTIRSLLELLGGLNFNDPFGHENRLTVEEINNKMAELSPFPPLK